MSFVENFDPKWPQKASKGLMALGQKINTVSPGSQLSHRWANCGDLKINRYEENLRQE